MPNERYIILPSPPGTFRMEEEAERHPPRVYKRPSRRPLPPSHGRVMMVTNETVVLPDGTKKELLPLQVAILALPDAINRNIDYIHVHTPRFVGVKALQSQAEVRYAVRDVVGMVMRWRNDPVVNPPRDAHGVIHMPDDGAGPTRYKLTENGVFAPYV